MTVSLALYKDFTQPNIIEQNFLTCSHLVWSALALPTLKTIKPNLRDGAVILTDNIIFGAEGYKDLLEYFRAPENGFQNLTLPYTNGFEMSVYLPRSKHD